jgi:hypothetical protein
MPWAFPIQLHSEFLPHLLAILGLLMTWELHDIEVRAGRIRPRPALARRAILRWVRVHGGSRLYILAAPNDEHSCVTCRQAYGKVFSAAAIKNKRFRPMDNFCTNPSGCRCELVGLVGNWPAAEQLSKTLRQSGQPTILSESQMVELTASAGALPRGPDRPALYLLEALRAEGVNPQFAMSRYRSLIFQAVDGEVHGYVVPAYLRLSDLLERAGNLAAALDVVDEFMTIVRGARNSADPPNRSQIKIMSARRARLLRLLQTQ